MDFHEYFRMNYTDANKNPSGPPAGLYSQQKLLTDAATEKVATLIGDDFSCPDLFCQMDVLRPYLDDVAWKEIGRWVRYEEAVEEGGERWSKPHVASLMMEALLELQDLLASCPVFIDFPAKSITEIADAVVRAWMDDGNFPYMLRDHYKAILLKEHLFQHLSKKEMKKKHASSPNLARMQNESYINGSYESTEKYSLTVPTTSATMPKNMLPKVDPPTPHTHHKTHLNTAFLKKIPPGSEVVNLMVGEIEELEHSISAFIKLKDASNVGDITEVDLPTKFMFIILGPANSLGPSAEMCRCLATLFTDEVFRCVAHRAKDREDLLAGISEFSQHLTVLPPGAWDPSTRIEPPDEIPSQEHRKGGQTGTMSKNKSTVSLHSMDNSVEADEHEEESHCDPTLVRTGRLFGGLIADVKRKIPHYLSDFKDALHIQCVASFFFLFLATLTPNVTFGGLLGQATDQYMGAMECILSAAISGVIFALFAGQPLNILGSTGPMLVLENILYQFCKDQEWDFLPFRVWVGFWTALMIMLIVAFDLSALVRFITRFTEESFACLIALIFIYEAFKKTFEISKIAPVHIGPPSIDSSLGCCILQQGGNLSYTSMYVPPENATERDIFKGECEFGHGSFVNHSCPHGVDHYVPDVFFFSVILFLGTFVLSTALVNFRHSLFFPTFVRQNVSDFAVLISIIIMVVFDALVGLPTPKLQVPVEFKPSRPGRPWLINPISDKNPWWLMLLSAVPALLATILIFMDQQITAVIVNRRENKLKKGSGYHLDMLVVAILVVVLALLGLPWYVAATVTALAHIMSLRKVSECTAPGEKPVFLGVREQRVTALLVGIFSGMAVFLTSVLNYVPMAVLYGVFLFMGVAPLGNMQLIQRIMLVFMPTKYQPEYAYIRNVPIRRVHLFTAIQVVNLIGLWIVKSIKSISIAFPLMVLIICFVRKALDLVFTQRELKWLDDILPPIREKKETPVQVQPVFIKVTEFDDAESVATTIGSEKPPTVRKLSVPVYEREKETDIDKDVRETYDKVKQRQSLTFGCKTEIDQLKGQRPAYLTDRRQSLIMAVERKKSLQSDGLTASRRISGQSTDGVLSANQPLGHTHSHGHSSAAHVEEHNRINRILSLPATIEDEPEIEDKKK